MLYQVLSFTFSYLVGIIRSNPATDVKVPNNLLSVKNTKVSKQKSVCRIKLFWLVCLVNFHIYNNSKL